MFNRDVVVCSTPNQVGVECEIFTKMIYEEAELPAVLQTAINAQFNFDVQFSDHRIFVTVRKTVYSKEIDNGS